MTRKQVERELRASVRKKAKEQGWSQTRTKKETEKVLKDVDWVMECQRRIKLKQN